MCFHPDHWTWWVVRPSNLVDFIAMAKMKEAIQELPVLSSLGMLRKISWKSPNLPVGAYLVGRRFWEHLKLPEVNFLRLQSLTLRVYPSKILKIFTVPPPQKKGKDRWASSKSIIFSIGVHVSFWGGDMTVGWNEIQTKRHSPNMYWRILSPKCP